MARNLYQYETSPRKLEPEYVPTKKRKVTKQTETQKGRITKKEEQKKAKTAARDQKIKKIKQVSIVVLLFTILLAISYRNSLINEEFSQIKTLKNNLATIKKENGQINKSIEENLNKEKMEQIATQELGMQKKSKEQTVEITIEKSDYIETVTQEVEEEKEQSFFEKIINSIF